MRWPVEGVRVVSYTTKRLPCGGLYRRAVEERASTGANPIDPDRQASGRLMAGHAKQVEALGARYAVVAGGVLVERAQVGRQISCRV